MEGGRRKREGVGRGIGKRRGDTLEKRGDRERIGKGRFSCFLQTLNPVECA